MIAGFFSCVGKNFAGFGIFLPFAFRVMLGHKTLLAHEEQIEGRPVSRASQCEIERAASPANGFARAGV